MAKVKVKPRSTPAAVKPPEPGCEKCRRWSVKVERVRGVPPAMLHEKVCVPAAAFASENPDFYFSVPKYEIQVRESERLLAMLGLGYSLGSEEQTTKPQTAPVAPRRDPTPDVPKVTRKPAPTQPKRSQGGLTGKDAFGFKAGSGAALINTVLTEQWKTIVQIEKDCGCTRKANGQLQRMCELGFAVKEGKDRFKLTPKGVQTKGQ